MVTRDNGTFIHRNKVLTLNIMNKENLCIGMTQKWKQSKFTELLNIKALHEEIQDRKVENALSNQAKRGGNTNGNFLSTPSFPDSSQA